MLSICIIESLTKLAPTPLDGDGEGVLVGVPDSGYPRLVSLGSEMESSEYDLLMFALLIFFVMKICSISCSETI